MLYLCHISMKKCLIVRILLDRHTCVYIIKSIVLIGVYDISYHKYNLPSTYQHFIISKIKNDKSKSTCGLKAKPYGLHSTKCLPLQYVHCCSSHAVIPNEASFSFTSYIAFAVCITLKGTLPLEETGT